MRRGFKPLVLATLALPLWLAQPAVAAPQEEPAKEGAKAAEKTPEQIAEKDFHALNNAYKQARSDYYKKYSEFRKAKKDGTAGEPPVSPDVEYAKKFAEGAAKHAGNDGATLFLMQTIGMTYRSDAALAKTHLNTLLEKHATSPKLATMTFTLVYGTYSMGEPTVRHALDTIIEKNGHDDVKAAMHYARGSIVNRSKASTAEQREAAVADMRKAVTLAPKSRYGSMATSTIYELENLQVGMEAPDIEGNDLDGVAFKLSDYRGRVVFLDFWGDW